MLVCESRRRVFVSLRPSRQGLAPVELILALPIWMMLAALMVLMGTTGVWRLRTQVVAREAAFRAVWPRNPEDDNSPPQEWWAPSATMSTSAASPAVMTDDPFASHAVIRGPVLVEPLLRLDMAVDPAVMPTAISVIRGEASLNHHSAVWQRSGYRYQMSREFPVLSGEAGQFAADSLDLRDRRRAGRIWELDAHH
jgi:hypothetical protein